MEGEVITLQDAFVFERTGLTADGRVIGRFRGTGIRPRFFDKLKASGIELPMAAISSVVAVN
jgi:pilus assembly protein CpaF